MRRPRYTRRLAALAAAAIGALGAAAVLAQAAPDPAAPAVTLEGRAVLPALTFAEGPLSGTLLGLEPINGVTPPFDGQPVQGFSGVVDNGDGSYLALPDNGFGSLENSADFNLRVYTIRPSLKTAEGGDGTVAVEGFIELHDPDEKIPFTIVNHFTDDRVLTGADFDVESIQRAPDGTLWLGDEFGPFLLHVDAEGKVLDAPVPLPDADNPGTQVRAPQNPLSEESNAVRAMNALRAHARAHGAGLDPIFSPNFPLLDDGDPATGDPSRIAPPPGSGLPAASSDIFSVTSLHAAGFQVVPWTINDLPTMKRLLTLGVDGIISDRSDLLYQAVAEHDADGDGTPGDFLGDDGLIDTSKLDAQGHRGSRDLRPENTLPAMEAGLDNLMNTLETDTGITADGVPVLSHDAHVAAYACRTTDGSEYTPENQELIKGLTVEQIQSRFVCDKVFRGETQKNDLALSPVAAAFAAEQGIVNPYAIPTLAQLFDFVDFYVEYYETGAGASEPDAANRALNARQARFNIETKINPETTVDEQGDVLAERTVDPETFARAVAGAINHHDLQPRATVQSFDWRTLLVVQEEEFPRVRTVALADDSSLSPQAGESNTRWLAGLPWPYRVTLQANPFRAGTSSGFEGMAITPDGRSLLPLLEKPLAGDPAGRLQANVYDIAQGAYTGERRFYQLEVPTHSIGDFILIGPRTGLVIERDNEQGPAAKFKRVYKVTDGKPGTPVGKTLVADLLHIQDPDGVSVGEPGDFGIGPEFAFPFQTIESIALLDPQRVVILNDNNFPNSVGRHVGSGAPDDEELIVLKLPKPVKG